MSPDLRNIIERAYLVNPRRTASELISLGLGDVATDLKTDFQTGRLQENQSALDAPSDADRRSGP